MKIRLGLALLMSLFALRVFAADLSGTWVGTITMPSQPSFAHEMRLELKVDGQTVTGTMTGGPPDRGTRPVLNGKLVGDDLSFEYHFEFRGKTHRTLWKAKVVGNQLKDGTRIKLDAEEGRQPPALIWDATKQ